MNAERHRTDARPRSGAGRVGMFVLNDLRFDSRVRREAETLAEAGYDVTVYAVESDATVGRSDADESPFRIVRVPMMMRPTDRAVPRPASRADVSPGAGAGAGAGGGASADPPMSASLRVKGALAATFAATRPILGGTIHLALNWRLRWSAWGRAVRQRAEPADIWHAHDFTTLAAAVACARRHGGRVVYDSHEIFVESATMSTLPPFVRAFITQRERALVERYVDAVLTVNESVAEVLRQRLNVRDVVVVRNCADPPPVFEGPSPLREALGFDERTPIALYHGSLVRGRGLELLIAAIADPRLAGCHLVVMGYGPERSRLQAMAARSPARDRIRFIAPVPPDDVTRWVSGATVAAMPIEPTTLNHRLSSPNKLFEAIAAGVPVVAPDFPEIRRIVAPGPEELGVLHADHSPASIAEAIHRVVSLPEPELAAWRERCRRKAETRWNWRVESAALLELYASLQAETAADEVRSPLGLASSPSAQE